MNIIVNGDKISIEKNINLENFLKLNNINNKNIVIEVNKIIITKSMWKEKKIKEGDVIEIITAVGGG
ncbi:MAG: sulfur carrier protein ThiS [Gammaproteobacteria bacterium]|mgnify:FL=1|jgi:sulfur carrier protein|nr:sulfur carrier protein ThiS [Gammaproteobacteria bacterium]MBT7523278.1 sulfur carrier protein ThiS [Gammaproteobacteria bacterium]MDC3386257.1 sulfur carrier protein ThiS [Gammaproteobacteria bacterium]|tara:strand:- start:224 stop:424 length:201 start_codon:yes stop_codon:yes gene_type:complete